ncbi:hypothetical protein BT93_H2328 [Corymbia citriodora subsp. variegata]|nr:hypothetical protein BT93_H2328 [Corymbia citriodora subsp. variegata]
MSRPHDAQRPFFPFGNPFRMISPKGSQLSSKLLVILNNFEETLAEKFRKLDPKETGDVLSLSWMEKAMKSLCETHSDVKNLITALELPVCDWDDKWIDVYLDISVKLLDICNAFSSEISRLNQGRLMLQCVLHNLESSSPEQFIRASSSLDRWRQHISSRNPRFANCGSILESLRETLDLPKVKNSAKGKVLMQAMYGVKVQTLFVCSIFVAAFSGPAKKPLELSVSGTHLWSLSFTNLLMNVNSNIRNRPSSGSVAIFKELEAVEANVKKLSPLIRSGEGTVEEESVRSSVSSLRGSVDRLSQELDLLEKEVDGFFQIVLTGRDALLCNLRANGPASAQMQKNIVER